MAQSVKCLTLDFGSGHDFTVWEMEPSITLRTDRAEPVWDSLFSLSLSLSLSAPPLLALFLKLNKSTLRKEKERKEKRKEKKRKRKEKKRKEKKRKEKKRKENAESKESTCLDGVLPLITYIPIRSSWRVFGGNTSLLPSPERNKGRSVSEYRCK